MTRIVAPVPLTVLQSDFAKPVKENKHKNIIISGFRLQISRSNVQWIRALTMSMIGLAFLLVLGSSHDDEVRDFKWQNLFSMAVHETSQGSYSKAENHLLAAVAIAENFPSEDDRLAECLDRLSRIYYKDGRFAKSEALARRGLKLREANYGQNHISIAQSSGNLGSILRSLSRLAEAEPLLARSLKIYSANLNVFDPLILTARHNLAETQIGLLKFVEAQRNLEENLSLQETAFGPKHLEVASTLQLLGFVQLSRRELVKCEHTLTRALEIRELHLGPENREVERTLTGLVVVFLEKHDLARAEPLAHRSLKIAVASWGAKHQFVAEDYYNLGLISRATHNINKSIEYFEQSYSIYRDRMGALSPATLKVRAMLDSLARERQEEKVSGTNGTS